MKHKKLLLVLVLVMMLAASVWAQSNTDAVIGGNDTQLRSLISRWVIGYGSNPQTSVYVGEFAPDMLMDVALPADAVLVGTLVRSDVDGNGAMSYEVMFDSRTMPEAIADFYTETLTAAGLDQKQVTVTNPSGFSTWMNVNMAFCADDYTFWVDGYGNVGEPLQLTARISQPVDEYLCSEENTNVYYDPVAHLIPAFTPIAGVTVNPNRNGIMSLSQEDGSIYAELTITSDLASAFTAYNEQLTNAGWTLAHNDSSSASAISHWTLSDEEGNAWYGTLTLFSSGHDNQYWAYVIVQKQ